MEEIKIVGFRGIVNEGLELLERAWYRYVEGGYRLARLTFHGSAAQSSGDKM
jgi:hypothetical protein